MLDRLRRRGAFIVLAGENKVDYVGRSSSILDWGERVTLIKPDGSVLVHRGSGYDAVNWQPPGSHIETSLEDDVLKIRVIRRTPKEELILQMRTIMVIDGMILSDDASFQMFLTEEDLYQAIRMKPELIERGFRITSEQKDMKNGIPDMIGVDRDGNYVVLEVKKEPADENAVKQLYRYLGDTRETSKQVRGIVAAPGLRESALTLMRTLHLEFVRLDLKECERLLRGQRRNINRNLDEHLKR